MIVRIERHPKAEDLLVVHAGPECGALMGPFASARWQKNSRAYWMPAKDLDLFARHLERNGATLIDERSTGGPTGPLPECRHCGQPAKRGAQIRFCGGCGQPWEPVVHQAAHGADAARQVCPHCGRGQHGGMDRCLNCGQLMPVIDVTGRRPLIPDRPRETLDAPVAFGDVLAGTDPDGAPAQLPLDQETTP